MSYEITCPYCEHEYDLCHDDGAFYEDGESEETECPECEKTFIVSSSIIWFFEGTKADCLNGAEHKWEQQNGVPKEYFVGRFTCRECGREEHRDEEGQMKALREYRDNLGK